jgi:hypothetical protein
LISDVIENWIGNRVATDLAFYFNYETNYQCADQRKVLQGILRNFLTHSWKQIAFAGDRSENLPEAQDHVSYETAYRPIYSHRFSLEIYQRTNSAALFKK